MRTVSLLLALAVTAPEELAAPDCNSPTGVLDPEQAALCEQQLPADVVEPEPPSEPSPPECRRRDFPSLEAFVACQEGDQPRDPAPPPPPALSPQAQARQDELREDYEQKLAEEARYSKRRTIFIALGASSMASGFITSIVGSLLREPRSSENSGFRDGPMCMVGKPCGNTCISVEDECHIGGGGSGGEGGESSGERLSKAGIITLSTGLTLMAAGVGFFVAAAFAKSKRDIATLLRIKAERRLHLGRSGLIEIRF